MARQTAGLGDRAIICLMPRPRNERQALEQELDESTSQIAAHRQELDATPVENKERRERLVWQIRRDGHA